MRVEAAPATTPSRFVGEDQKAAHVGVATDQLRDRIDDAWRLLWAVRAGPIDCAGSPARPEQDGRDHRVHAMHEARSQRGAGYLGASLDQELHDAEGAQMPQRRLEIDATFCCRRHPNHLATLAQQRCFSVSGRVERRQDQHGGLA